MNYSQKQKGSLYMTVILLGIVMAIAIGVVGIVVTGSSLASGLGDSVRAFHIADTGIEKALYDLIKSGTSPTIDCNEFSFYGKSACLIQVTIEGDEIKATGSYNGSQRRIEAIY